MDTSGEVWLAERPRQTKAGQRESGLSHPVRWADLSPFVQGYVTAMFATGINRPECEGCPGDHPEDAIDVGCCRFDGRFSDLAPETLAAILKDCERLRDYVGGDYGGLTGAQFWEGRQRREGFEDLFPPLTPYLGDDGKIRFQPLK